MQELQDIPWNISTLNYGNPVQYWTYLLDCKEIYLFKFHLLRAGQAGIQGSTQSILDWLPETVLFTSSSPPMESA